LLQKGKMLTDNEKQTLEEYRTRHNSKLKSNELDAQSFLEFFVMSELSNFKEGTVTSNLHRSTLKSGKGSSGLDMRDSQTRNRIRSLQINSNIRTVLALITDTITATRIVTQKLQSIMDFLSNEDNPEQEENDPIVQQPEESTTTVSTSAKSADLEFITSKNNKSNKKIKNKFENYSFEQYTKMRQLMITHNDVNQLIDPISGQQLGKHY